MKIFFNILQLLIGRKKIIYPDDPFDPLEDYSSTQHNLTGTLIMCLIQTIWYKLSSTTLTNTEVKFMCFNQTITNSFMENKVKEDFINVFCRAQKTYFAFIKLFFIYKHKKCNTIVNTDLSLNPIEPNNENTFQLIQDKSKYLFSVNDLVSIIETAICHSSDFFSEPLWPLNPYNKQRLSLSSLYNIYFKLKNSKRLISLPFHYFFLENFNLDLFAENHEAFIRSFSIKKFVFNSPFTSLKIDVLTMLKKNYYTSKLVIHPDFPEDKLVNIFRPFLFYYYTINYDIRGTTKLFNYRRVLYIKLKKFYDYNKLFGRKYIELKYSFINSKKKISKKNIKFNDKHLQFHSIPVSTEEIHNTKIRSANESLIFGNEHSNLFISISNYITTNIDTNENENEDEEEQQEEQDENEDEQYDEQYEQYEQEELEDEEEEQQEEQYELEDDEQDEQYEQEELEDDEEEQQEEQYEQEEDADSIS